MKTELEKIIHAFIKSMNAFDVKTALTLFTKDAVINDVSVGETFKNTAGVRKYLEQYFVGYNTATKRESIQIISAKKPTPRLCHILSKHYICLIKNNQPYYGIFYSWHLTYRNTRKAKSMKTKLLTFLTITMSISLFTKGQNIPKSWSPSTKITAHYGGGMMYYSYDILISDTLSYMKIVSNKGAENYSRKFTKAELDSILTFLNTHHFHKIKSEHAGFAHDKASESMSLSFDNNYIGVSESASMRVTEKYRDDFRNVQAYIVGLFKKEE